MNVCGDDSGLIPFCPLQVPLPGQQQDRRGWRAAGGTISLTGRGREGAWDWVVGGSGQL